MKRNYIAHCFSGNTDKYYVLSVRKFSGVWQVIALWGRVGRNPQEQIKGEWNDEREATYVARILFEEKLKRGYNDIDSPDYPGTLCRHALGFLAPEDDVTLVPPVEPIEQQEKTIVKKTFPVLCVNSIGLNHLLTEGNRYEACETGDADMLKVRALFGEVEVFAERFQRV